MISSTANGDSRPNAFTSKPGLFDKEIAAGSVFYKNQARVSLAFCVPKNEMKFREPSLKVGRYASLPAYSMLDNFCLTGEGTSSRNEIHKQI